MARLSLVVGAILLFSSQGVSGTALPMPSSCREDDAPSYLLPNGGGIGRVCAPTLNPVEKNERFVLDEVWTRHLKWKKLGKGMKNKVFYGRVSALVLLFSANIFNTLSQSAGAYEAVFKMVGAASVSAGPFILKHFANKDMVQDYTQAIAIAEKIKGEVYRFQAGTPPYEKRDFEAVKRLVNDVTEMSGTNDMDLTLQYARLNLTKKEETPYPTRMGRAEYLDKRFQPQLDEYLEDARWISKKVDVLKKAEGVLLAASAVIGPMSCTTGLGRGYAMYMKKLSAWPNVVNTAALALGTHYHSCKYEEEAEQLSNSAKWLENLRLKLPHDAEPDVGGAQENEWVAFVNRCEEAIIETTVDWSILKNRPDKPKTGEKAKGQ